MADHVITLRGADAAQPAAALTGPNVCIAQYTFDVAKLIKAGYSAAAADTFTVRVFGARSLVLAFHSEVVQVDSGGAPRTLDVGDGDSATYWHTALDLKTAAATVPLDGVATATAKQKAYGVAGGNLLLTLDHDLVDAIVKFQWAYIPFMPYQDVES